MPARDDSISYPALQKKPGLPPPQKDVVQLAASASMAAPVALEPSTPAEDLVKEFGPGEIETHTTCCHNCQDQGKEVEVVLYPEDGVFKGVCECGEEACFECPPDVEQFGELAEEDRNEWIEKAKAENPGEALSDKEWWGRGRTLYIESLYEAAGGEW